ncbi:hypothetical protein [Dapis sp. BLCC M229]|uniref:hypothetical protein n=1 Tax=Dapis sp. BLCC M229 TaxID=3400188 RepID=UPI003CE8B92C
MKPKLRVSQKNIEFTSDKWGEKLIKTIRVSNPIPETILSGRWEVAPHVSDSPHTPYDHSWISFSPQKFEGNDVECKITSELTDILINKSKFYQLLYVLKKIVMVIFTIGFYLGLGGIFPVFIKRNYQLEYITLEEFSVLAGEAIASLDFILIILGYVIFKPIKIMSQYKKTESKLIRA